MSASGGKEGLAEWRRYWFLPLAGALGYATSVQHIYGLGPFFEPLHQEFGWSRAQVSSGIAIASVLSAIMCIPMGILLDRVGPRRIALLGIPLMTITVSLLSTATGSATNWLVLFAIVSIGTMFVQAPVWTAAVASRFEKSRGIAFAATLSGASLATAFFPVLATQLIAAYGWRTAFIAMACIWCAIALPCIFIFFRGAQDSRREAKEPEAEARVHEGITLVQALRMPTFYKLMVAAWCFSFTMLGVVVHFVPILKDRGAEPLAAAGIASLIGLFSIIGRLGTGFLLDRFPARFVGAIAFLAPIIGCALLLLNGADPTSQMIAAAVFGLTVGAEVDVVAYLTSRHFGLKSFGAVYGAFTMALALGTAFGPLAAGSAFDNFGGYAVFLYLTIGLMALSSLILTSLRPPPFAAAGHA